MIMRYIFANVIASIITRIVMIAAVVGTALYFLSSELNKPDNKRAVDTVNDTVKLFNEAAKSNLQENIKPVFDLLKVEKSSVEGKGSADRYILNAESGFYTDQAVTTDELLRKYYPDYDKGGRYEKAKN